MRAIFSGDITDILDECVSVVLSDVHKAKEMLSDYAFKVCRYVKQKTQRLLQIFRRRNDFHNSLILGAGIYITICYGIKRGNSTK